MYDKELKDQNRKMLEYLQQTKPHYNAFKMDNQRRSLEHSLLERRSFKYPHLFKIDEIITKQKREKENMMKSIE